MTIAAIINQQRRTRFTLDLDISRFREFVTTRLFAFKLILNPEFHGQQKRKLRIVASYEVLLVWMEKDAGVHSERNDFKSHDRLDISSE